MKDKMRIENYEQLKAISDPLRVKIMSFLLEEPYTGKQLGELLETSPSKIHYHLKELENVGLIEVIKTEVKNGIVQKFYKSVAYTIEIDDHLLPHVSEIKESVRESIYMIASRAKNRVLTAPEDAFTMVSSDHTENPFISLQAEVKIKKEAFIEWSKKFNLLMKELFQLESDDGEWFYLANLAFKIDEPRFSEIKGEDKENED